MSASRAVDEPAGDDVRRLPDLAARPLGGSVVHADDESFAERHHLIRPEPPVFDPGLYGARGKVYDGWETRRRREPGHDSAVVRLGAPGVIRGVVVDTAWFTGNYPPEVSVEAACLAGYPAVDEVLAADWTELVPRGPLSGNSAHEFPVRSARRWTHVRLSIYPDGGVARLRVHGEVVPDPDLLDALGTVDLAALEHGGAVVGCSNWFYSRPDNLISPGTTRNTGEGWETARRRDGGDDWVVLRLATPGHVRVAEVDTTGFLGNAPGAVTLLGADLPGRAEPGEGGSWEDGSWTVLMSRTRVQPDTRHRFLLGATPRTTHVRMVIHPDGGMSRLRLWGRPDRAGLDDARRRWHDTGPVT